MIYGVTPNFSKRAVFLGYFHFHRKSSKNEGLLFGTVRPMTAESHGNLGRMIFLEELGYLGFFMNAGGAGFDVVFLLSICLEASEQVMSPVPPRK